MSWKHTESLPLPWYRLLWGALWFIPVEIFGALFLLAILIGWGLAAAREMRRVINGTHTD